MTPEERRAAGERIFRDLLQTMPPPVIEMFRDETKGMTIRGIAEEFALQAEERIVTAPIFRLVMSDLAAMLRAGYFDAELIALLRSNCN